MPLCFGGLGLRKFFFQLCDARQSALEFLRQGAGELVVGNADGFVHAAQGILGDDFVFFPHRG